MYKIPLSELQTRRDRVAELMPANSILVLFSAEVQTRNADTEYPFRQDSDFWYLTGINEEDGVYVLKLDHDRNREEYLYVAPFDPSKEQWTGKKLGKDGAAEVSGIEAVSDHPQFEQDWPELFGGGTEVFVDLGGQSYRELRNRLGRYLTDDARRGVTERIESVSRTNLMMSQLRGFKSDWEGEQMRISARIAVEAHERMYRALVEGMKKGDVYEYQLEAELLYGFRKEGAPWSYPPIVATGANACTLHYTANDAKVGQNDLVLVDAGCEYGYYASDITRCYPASGTFTEPQKRVYNTVLKAQYAALDEAAREGGTTGSIHETAIRVLTEGLVELGVLSGDVDELIENREYARYYMHGTGHYIGLDVHDVGTYRSLEGTRASVSFEPGMAITIEPGLYFTADDETVPAELRGIGVRIEDDIVKTDSGIENLTEAIPKEIDQLESLIQ